MSKAIVEAASRFLGRRTARRGFLTKSAVVGSALAVAPKKFILEPGTAYATVITCNGFTCQPGNLCCDGYTEFCCTLYGTNGCPPGSLYGGWWKVSGSSYCGGNNRYYMDCHSQCGGCGCGANGVCSGACNGTPCGCGAGSCFNRKAGCTQFRYGQCNTQIRCVGPIICRVVTCTPPWQLEPTCTTATRTDEATRWHNRACLQGPQSSGNDPFGSVDRIQVGSDGFRIVGWAIDPDVLGPIDVAIYVDGVEVTRKTANLARFDVGQAHIEHGPDHGYDIYVPAAVGTRRVCVYAINQGSGNRNPIIECNDVVIDPLNDPLGALEIVEATPEGLRVQGFATREADTTVDIMVNDEVAATVTTGDQGSFETFVPLAMGTHRVCAQVHIGNLQHAIGCQTVSMSSADTPVGGIDNVTSADGFVNISGWAMNPDANEPIDVTVTIDGSPVATARTASPGAHGRGEVGNAADGSEPGAFSFTFAAAPGTHRVCVYALGGGDPLLGCGDVVVT